MLKIKDQNFLIKICKVISWLDDKRWNDENNYNFIHFFRDDLTNGEKIFTHWICYITDRQMPFEVVWDKGGYVFSELVYEYKRSRLLPQQIIEKYYEKYSDKDKVRLRFKSSDNTLIRIACGLHLLTYQLDGKKVYFKETLRILNSEREYEKKLEYFKKNTTWG